MTDESGRHFKAFVIMNFVLDEKNPKLIEIYRRKADEYFERAAYLKKQVLQPDAQPQGGGSAAAQKPK